ncbi:MAG: phage holin family protein [Verrucomicrobiales bacterium]|jgi:uncharacterized membrane protein YqjE|nr:phage holin family protein [Verrucomicrobiales bacterium]
MSEFTSGQAGIFTSLKRLATNFIGVLETRGDLFVTELQEEKLRIMQLLIWTVIAAVLGAIALILLTLLLVVLFWNDDNRIMILAILSGIYLAGTVVAGCFLRKTLNGKARPFEETINQLKKDRECLGK